MSKKINYLLISGVVFIDLLLIILNEPSLNFLNQGIFRELEEPILQPIFLGSLPLILCLIVLLFFDASYLKNWLKYIVSWYIPVMVFFVSQIDVHSSFILSIDRSTAALYWMGGLFVITVVFCLAQKFFYRK